MTTTTTTRPRRWLPLALWAAALVLIALNAWWIWLDFRQPTPPQTIDRLIASGQPAQAEQALRNDLWYRPHDGQAIMQLARIIGQRDDYAACARQLEKVPNWWPEKNDALFLQAQALKAAQLSKELVEVWERCIAVDPLHPMPNRYYAGAARELIGHYMLQSRFDKARETLWKVYESADPSEHADILIMRMRAEVERIAHDDAVARLKRFVDASPDDWEARRALALESELTGDPAAANLHIQACLEARPQDPVVWSTYLQILQQRGDIEGIRQALTQIPAAAGDDPEVWKSRGLLHDRSNQLPEAAHAYEQARKARPYDPELLYKLSLVKNRQGEAEAARDLMKQSQDIRKAEAEFQDAYFNYLNVSQNTSLDDPTHQDAIKRMANICEVLGWKREAEAWRKVLNQT